MPIVEMIRCPACGKEIPQDVENCPNCGAPISVIMNNDISGAPIDNSAAIDAMLRSASQFIEESGSLGLDELDLFDEEEEEDDEEEEEEVFRKVTLKELPPELAELSPEQKDEIEAGGVINLSSAEEQAQPAEQPHGHRGKHKADAAHSGAAENFKELAPKQGGASNAAPPSQAPVSQGAPLPSFDDDEDDEAAEAEEAPAKKKKAKKEKPQKEKKPKKEKKAAEPALYEVDENGNPVKGKRPKKEKAKKEKDRADKSGKGKSSPLAAVIAAVVALAVGLGGGYFGKMFFFPDLPTPECQDFAQKAVDEVTEKLPDGQELYITEAYVKDGAISSQCIFRAIIESGEDISSSWYRVKIDHDNTNPSISKELDREEYERLRNSDNSEDRARAAVLNSNQNELERCINEVKAGDGWSAANISLINNNLHPYTEAPSKPTDASADQTE